MKELRYHIVELMIANGHGIVAHRVDDVDDVLAFRKSACRTTLHEVSRTDHSHIGCVGSSDGITQSCNLGITFDAAMNIIFIEDYDGTMHHLFFQSLIFLLGLLQFLDEPGHSKKSGKGCRSRQASSIGIALVMIA